MDCIWEVKTTEKSSEKTRPYACFSRRRQQK